MAFFWLTSGRDDPTKVKIQLERELSDLCFDDGPITEQASDGVSVSTNLLKLPTTNRNKRSNLKIASLPSAHLMSENVILNRTASPESWGPDGFHRARREATDLQMSSEDQIDLKSGTLLLLGQMDSEEYASRVFVKIFGNKYEQHAQFYTDANYSEQLGYISLRNCSVWQDEMNIKIIYIVIETTALTRQVIKLVAETGQEALEWARAFIPKHELSLNSVYSPRGSPCLPRSTRSSSVASESLDC